MKEEVTTKLRENPDAANQLPLIPGKGKNFMHLAVEYNAVQILAYLVIELNLDTNQMTAKQDDVFTKDATGQFEMGVLHLAILMDRLDMVELLMTNSKGLQLNLVSNQEGTPLHLACKMGHLKIVQKLVLAGADILVKHPVTGLLARWSTENQRIIFLLEKYEKHQKAMSDKKHKEALAETATNKSENLSDDGQDIS